VALEDKTLTCRDCGMEFVFSVGEQEFYTSKGLTNEPKRCPGCRSNRRREQSGNTGGNRPVFEVVCAECGKETTVPFEPTDGRPVYCRDCFTQVQQS
jgi:CxxC-x17-CxxC domain-containing protein